MPRLAKNPVELPKVETIPTPNAELFAPESTMAPSGRAQIVNGVQQNALGLESTAAMKHVSKEWSSKCRPLLSVGEQMEAQQTEKRDVYVPLTGLHLTPDLRLVIPHLGIDHKFTPFGLHTLITKNAQPMKSGVKDYFIPEDKGRYTPEQLAMMEARLADQINMELSINADLWVKDRPKKDIEDVDILLRMRKEGGSEIIRACMSDRYGIIDNSDVLNMIIDSLPKQHISDALCSHISNDGDNMHMNIFLPDLMKTFPDSDYGIGLAATNSEVGRYICRINAFLFRGVCYNGMIWGRRDMTIEVNKKHLGTIDWADLRRQTMQVCQTALSEGNNLLTQMNLSRDVKINAEQVGSVIAYLSREYKMTIEEGRAWYNGFLIEPYDSAFGIVNGLTRGAQEFEGEQRHSMETLAGTILTPSIEADLTAMEKKWAKAIDRSSELDSRIVAQYMVAAE